MLAARGSFSKAIFPKPLALVLYSGLRQSNKKQPVLVPLNGVARMQCAEEEQDKGKTKPWAGCPRMSAPLAVLGSAPPGLCPPGPGLGGAGEEGRRWHGAAVTPGSAGLKPSEHIPLVVSSATKLFCF